MKINLGSNSAISMIRLIEKEVILVDRDKVEI